MSDVGISDRGFELYHIVTIAFISLVAADLTDETLHAFFYLGFAGFLIINTVYEEARNR